MSCKSAASEKIIDEILIVDRLLNVGATKIGKQGGMTGIRQAYKASVASALKSFVSEYKAERLVARPTAKSGCGT